MKTITAAKFQKLLGNGKRNFRNLLVKGNAEIKSISDSLRLKNIMFKKNLDIGYLTLDCFEICQCEVRGSVTGTLSCGNLSVRSRSYLYESTIRMTLASSAVKEFFAWEKSERKSKKKTKAPPK